MFTTHCVKVLYASFSNAYIMAVTRQKEFIFGTGVPGRVVFDSIDTDRRVHASELG